MSIYGTLSNRTQALPAFTRTVTPGLLINREREGWYIHPPQSCQSLFSEKINKLQFFLKTPPIVDKTRLHPPHTGHLLFVIGLATGRLTANPDWPMLRRTGLCRDE
jgi:hypothetical protein